MIHSPGSAKSPADSGDSRSFDPYLFATIFVTFPAKFFDVLDVTNRASLGFSDNTLGMRWMCAVMLVASSKPTRPSEQHVSRYVRYHDRYDGRPQGYLVSKASP